MVRIFTTRIKSKARIAGNDLTKLLLLAFAFFYSSSLLAQTYCTPSSNTNGGIYYISNVTTTGGATNFNNTSLVNTATGYDNYTALVVTATQGTSFNLSATAYLFTYKWAIWADWNHDGDFDDAGEEMYTYLSTLGLISITTPIAVPATALPGNTRMRVRILRDWATDPLTPCIANVYSEIEDYTILVTSSSCSGLPAAGTTNAASTTVPCTSTTTLSLSGNAAGAGITYQWQYNTGSTWINIVGATSATATTPPISQTTQFRCVVTCTNPGGSSANSTPVTVNTTPIPINLGNDTTICPGISYTLNAGNAGATYLWSNGVTSQSIQVNTAGTYAVQVTTPGGCSGTDNIVITQGINPVNILPPTTNLCEGSTASLNAGNTGSTFLWSPNGQVTQTINETDGGTYSVAIKSVDGCKITSTTNVIIRPLPVDNLGNDTSICDGATIPLDAGNPGYAYQWSNGAATQVVNASDSGLYTVTVTTPFNCTNEDEIHISYLPSPRVEGFNFIPEFHENLGQVKFYPLNPTNVNSYLWDFGDGSATSTAVNPTHSYPAGGHYDVKLYVFNGCGEFEISLPINVDLTTGVPDLNEGNTIINLYPNPSNNNITIDNLKDGVAMKSIEVFNVLGAVVYQQNAQNGKQHSFNVAKFAAGVYAVRILTDKGFVVKRFEVLK